MATYLVTGATGFIGGGLLRRLLSDGQHEVRALLREQSDAARLEAAGCRVFRASLGDPNAIAEAAEGAEVVFHCAGESSHRASPRALSWIHVAGTENVLNAARHAGVRRVVHLSCADVTLVNANRTNVKEAQAVTHTPLDAWTRTKLLAEELALHASSRALEVCAVRPAWVWGPYDLHTLPALCAEALRGRVQLCGSGKSFLPTAHVDNVAHALVLAAHAEKAPGHAYHVLDGEMLCAGEFLGQLCSALGLSAPQTGSYWVQYALAALREQNGKPGLCRADVVRRGRSSVLDGVGAVRDLGYQPRVSVEAGMQGLAQWVQAVGGAPALAGLRRSAATDADAEKLARLADAAG